MLYIVYNCVFVNFAIFIHYIVMNFAKQYFSWKSSVASSLTFLFILKIKKQQQNKKKHTKKQQNTTPNAFFNFLIFLNLWVYIAVKLQFSHVLEQGL